MELNDILNGVNNEGNCCLPRPCCNNGCGGFGNDNGFLLILILLLAGGNGCGNLFGGTGNCSCHKSSKKHHCGCGYGNNNLTLLIFLLYFCGCGGSKRGLC